MTNDIRFGNSYAESLYKELKSLAKESDTDLMINEDGKVYIQNKNGEMVLIKEDFDNNKILPFAALLASHYDLTINGKHPLLDVSIPFDGSRVHIQIPPSTDRPILSLRFHKKAFRDINELTKSGMCTEKQRDVLISYVKMKKNIIINGETGSGKTTLLSALLNEVPSTERIVCIEDTKEITTIHPNITHSYTYDKTIFSDIDAVRSALRENPNRIVYGEVRDGGATLEFLKALNTGHKGGMCTIHANVHKNDYIKGVRTRLKSLCGEVSSSPQDETIDEALEVIIGIEVINGKRQITYIKDLKET